MKYSDIPFCCHFVNEKENYCNYVYTGTRGINQRLVCNFYYSFSETQHRWNLLSSRVPN